MTLVTDFKRGASPLWYFVDLVGVQFDDNFWLYVLENDIPYNFATVYHDVSGTIPWNNPIQCLPNGTFPIDIFFDRNKVYRLEFRQNLGLLPPSQNDPLIYLVPDYTPGDSNSIVDVTNTTIENQMTNQQFSVVNFAETFTLTNVTNPDPIEIAPGWFIDLVGIGNITVTRVPLNTTLSNPTNAPYALHISLSGAWTSNPVLRQRFQQNGMLWMGKTISTSITARMDGASKNIFARLDASNGQPLGILYNVTLTNNFVEYTNHTVIPTFINLDLPPDAYLDYKLFLPASGDFYLTSFQLVVAAGPVNIEYEQDTVDRQLDHLAHYYQPKLAYKPISSYLVGWDFAKNPAQIKGASVPIFAGANQAEYVWDQTIVYQTATNSVSCDRGANGGLELTCQQPGQIALIQYLDQIEARKILSDRASVNINASTTHANGLAGNVTLWACTDVNLPTLPTAGVSALAADGTPTMGNGTWIQVPNIYQNSKFTLQAASATNAESENIMLNGWDLAGSLPVNTATYFAIVIGFAPWIAADVINVKSISLCPGDIATVPAPKTLDETLLDTQRFFWKTFNQSTIPAQAVGIHTGEFNFVAALAGASTLYCSTLFFPTTMRVTPNITYYNPVSANANIRDESSNLDCSLTTNEQKTRKDLIFSCTGNAGTLAGNLLGVHLTADARLGVVN